MLDFIAARRMMVDGQVRTSDVTNPGLISAMLDVPRERFVPPGKAELAYLDMDVAVAEQGHGHAPRCLLKAMVFAKLVQAAEIDETDHVLDVGCATGYSAAVLARLSRSVVALEEDAPLADKASELLASLGATNVSVVTGPLSQGWPGRAPYDVILLNGTSEIIPHGLCKQLKDGGRLVGVFGGGRAGKAMLYLSDHGEVSGRPVFDAVAPLLPGFVKPPAFVF
ncbi:MAG: protein-L-isoaspartate O-methyltransferase family protein [Xanthobacteraceae bacterium]